MKTILRQLSFGLAFALLTTVAVLAAPRQYSLTVEGLVCPLCAYSARRNLGALDGVDQVEVDYRTGKALVTMKEGAVLEEATAKSAIESAGFELRAFQELENVPQQ